VSAEHNEVRRALRNSGLDQVVKICAAAEMVVAGSCGPCLELHTVVESSA